MGNEWLRQRGSTDIGVEYLQIHAFKYKQLYKRNHGNHGTLHLQKSVFFLFIQNSLIEFAKNTILEQIQKFN